MTEYAPPPDAGPIEDKKDPRLDTEIIDVLLRGLVSARDRLGSEGELKPDSLICAGFYYDGQHYCPILYFT